MRYYMPRPTFKESSLPPVAALPSTTLMRYTGHGNQAKPKGKQMGVNLFIPINKADATAENVERIVNLANAWACADPDDPDCDNSYYEGCDLYDGPGGHLMPIGDALKLGDDELPWFIILPDDYKPFMQMLQTETPEDMKRYSEILWCHPDWDPVAVTDIDNQRGPADWRGILRDIIDPTSTMMVVDSVLHLKCRL